MKNKCIKCQQIRKASGVSYLKCCKCKQKASDERKKNKKNKSEIAKILISYRVTWGLCNQVFSTS